MSETIDTHTEILNRLNLFIQNKSIPNIIFHGSPGCGKRTILSKFINMIYNDKSAIKDYVLYVNCAQGKGIKFIREDLKHFAKTHINTLGGNVFKSIILTNADKLTIDAQSALRRCIEVFSHTTRFFIIIEDKYKLLRPIMSRFCEIHIPSPYIDKTNVNLYKYNICQADGYIDREKNNASSVRRIINKLKNEVSVLNIHNCVETLYENGFSSLDVLGYFQGKHPFNIEPFHHHHVIFQFSQTKKEFRNEKLSMFFLINMFLLCSNDELENMLVM
jgi:DNA polymerase III delta prime subunit